MATSTLQCNANNDLYLVDGRNLGLLTGVKAVAQDVRLATLMRSGENQFNIDEGVKYFETIFTPQKDYDAARQSIIDNIEASPDVLSVDQLNITIQGDEFDFEAQVNTAYGRLPVSNQ